MIDPIRVWMFYDAPEEYQRLSGHGGDEDWLAHIPAETYARIGLPIWMTSGNYGGFGICDTSEHLLPDGSCVAIGAHA